MGQVPADPPGGSSGERGAQDRAGPDGPLGPPGFALVSWRDRAVVGVAVVALFGGFGQFGAVAALGDVAKTFGHLSSGTTFADQAGLSGTQLGVGLAILRLASLGGLLSTGVADRMGRRTTLLVTCAAGLALTAVAALSPTYWWFVAIFALGRPFLSGTGGVSQVSAVELTGSSDRATAVAMVAAGYGVGAGITAILYSLAKGALGFRGVFAMALVPLALLPLLRRLVVEPSRFRAVRKDAHRPPVLGPVSRAHGRRLVVVCLLAFAVSVVTGPANSLVFVYAQNVRHVSGIVTSAMVLGAGVAGLMGLLAGRALADRWGRRPAVALSLAGIALCGVVTYSGTRPALIVGYIGGVAAGSLFAPAGGALANELFPTNVRASVAGWYIAAGVLGAVAGLVLFGSLADVGGVGNHVAFAAVLTFLPMIPAAALLVLLPETRGREPEELWGA